MNKTQLQETARALVANGKGILAADESTGTITSRFKTISVESTEASRRDYREMLFRTKDLGKYVSGVILYDETLRQKAADGTLLRDILISNKIMPGIKVDTGAKKLAGSSKETVTEGLDGLAERMAEYAGLGARFAKWRAVIKIEGGDLPTQYCIETNAHALARYARICQEAGVVPIVEPEVLIDGNHDIDRCDTVTAATLHTVFHELHLQGICLEGMLLKPSMVVSGKDCPKQAGIDDVAGRTVACLRRTVPAAVPGIVFLSGGQSDEVATAHLNAMNAKFGPNPWKLSFSYGRALQDLALKRWKGLPANVAAAQQALHFRSKFNALAAEGRYSAEMERELKAA